MKKEACYWYEDGDDSRVYSTDCGKYFTFSEGTPNENEMKFCPFCGRPSAEKQTEEEK